MDEKGDDDDDDVSYDSFEAAQSSNEDQSPKYLTNTNQVDFFLFLLLR